MRHANVFGLMLGFTGAAFAVPDYTFTGSADTTVFIDGSTYISGGNVPLNVQGGSDGTISIGYYRGVHAISDGGGTGLKAEGSIGVDAIAGDKGVMATGGNYGVYGATTNGVGMKGESTNGVGISATSHSNYAVQAVSTQSVGVHATGNYYGIMAYNTDTYEGSAVYALGSANGALGVDGQGSIGVSGYGIGSGSNIPTGIYGNANGGYEAIGVFGTASGGSSDNWAGKFNGKVYASAGYFPSDIKLKKNVVPLSKGLKTVMNLNPKQYEMKVDEYKGKLNLTGGTHFGLIAQEVEGVLPELIHQISMPADLSPEERKNKVKKEPTEFKSVDYTSLIPVLIQAIKEQQAEIEDLKRALGR